MILVLVPGMEMRRNESMGPLPSGEKDLDVLSEMAGVWQRELKGEVLDEEFFKRSLLREVIMESHWWSL